MNKRHYTKQRQALAQEITKVEAIVEAFDKGFDLFTKEDLETAEFKAYQIGAEKADEKLYGLKEALESLDRQWRTKDIDWNTLVIVGSNVD